MLKIRKEVFLDAFVTKKKTVENEEELINFIKSRMVGLQVEQLSICGLDEEGNVVMWTDGEGFTRQQRQLVSIKMIDIARMVAIIEPFKLVIAHNHPSGTVEASESDRETTNKVNKLCQELGVEFKGHYIVAGENILKLEGDGTQ